MHGMMKLFSNFKDFYNDINGATLTGAIDVIVVEHPDGTYRCSPFHVRFGKLGVLRSKEKVVDIEINGESQDIHMKLGESGEAFFVEELEDDEHEIPEHLATSPLPVIQLDDIFKTQGRRRSFDLSLDNQINDYSKRRYTDDNENIKTRDREFLKRQIGLGNIDIGEQSNEDITLSMNSNKISSEDLSKSQNDVSETIFKMDSIDTPTAPAPAESKSNKKKRKKMRRKNAPRKSSSINQLPGSSTGETMDKISDSVTDRSSLDSNSSEPELKDLQKMETTDSSNIKMIDADFHFFSDTELTNSGNADSRSGSPVHVETVQSDSEFEVKFRKVEEPAGETSKNWEWGRFPSVSQNSSPISENPTKEEQKSMLSGMFSFMKQKHGAQNIRQQGGMYLSEISSSVDPEVAEIYFTKSKSHRDAEDCESGNGPSLAQSPNSAEGCKSIDSDFEEHHHKMLLNQQQQDISLSICGWDPAPDEERFLQNVVKFSDLCNNPMLLENDKVVVRIRGQYYTWKVASPIIASLLIYGRPLLQSTIDQLCSVHMPKEEPKQEVEFATELPVQDNVPKSSWWYWRRTNRASRETTPDVVDSPEEIIIKETVIDKSQPIDVQTTIKKDCPVVESPEKGPDKCRKTLRLSSKQIACLNLRDGVNELKFSVTTAYQGTTRCQCYLYKWKWDDKIVISDIDGTITKSDVLGHILPIVGKDWAQSGVAQLFNKIKDNGYKLLYLSARAIGQARITREYLKSIKQGDLSMPDGPILLNPTSLITAFHREVIEKKPEQFKISCMADIKALFPADPNPFYAGYGNRINDVWAYTAVGIPIVRIFTINPKGELKHELTQTFQSSYSGQSMVVNDLFPPQLEKLRYFNESDCDSDYSDSESFDYVNMSNIVDQLFPPLLEAANDYSQFIYWRDPVPVLEDLPDME